MVHFRQLDLQQEDDFAVLREHIGLLYAELFGEDAVPSKALFARMAEQVRERAPAHWAFVGTSDEGNAVAFVTLAESFAVFAHGVYGIINELWVHPEHRSRGVGRCALEHCREFAVRRGWHRIDVSAPPMQEWDRSFAFYQKHGYALTGRKLKLLVD